MFKWLRSTIRMNLRDYRRGSIAKRLSSGSRFQCDSSDGDFIALGRCLKEAERMPHVFFNYRKFMKRLDCIKADEGWKIGFASLLMNRGRKLPVLYSYKGERIEDFEFLENLYKDSLYNEAEMPRIKDNPMSVYHHIKVEQTPMGAWQAYLLDKLPFVYDDYKNYRKNHDYLIFSYSDLQPIMGKYSITIPDQYDLSPHVAIEGNRAQVSCCWWQHRGGLIRSLESIEFKDNRVVDILYIDSLDLFPYNRRI